MCSKKIRDQKPVNLIAVFDISYTCINPIQEDLKIGHVSIRCFVLHLSLFCGFLTIRNIQIFTFLKRGEASRNFVLLPHVPARAQPRCYSGDNFRSALCARLLSCNGQVCTFFFSLFQLLGRNNKNQRTNFCLYEAGEGCKEQCLLDGFFGCLKYTFFNIFRTRPFVRYMKNAD